MWQSADPILAKYLPTGDKEKDKNLPGMGGIYNSSNLAFYSYGHQNPIKLIDPDGNEAKRNRDTWVWNILNFFTDGMWEKHVPGDAPAVPGSDFSDRALKVEADFTVAGDIKALVTGTNFSGEKYSTFGYILAMAPLIGKIPGVSKVLSDGMRMSTNDALSTAISFLGEGYKDMGRGRFLSKDGLRQVRMGDSDILGLHGGGPHINFELFDKPLQKGSKPVENFHIFLDD